MHDVYVAPIFSKDVHPPLLASPFTGISSVGMTYPSVHSSLILVVGQGITIRIAESHALGQRLGEILYIIDRQMVQTCQATSLGGFLSRTPAESTSQRPPPLRTSSP